VAKVYAGFGLMLNRKDTVYLAEETEKKPKYKSIFIIILK
jgi:hypothetical protein